MNQFLSLLLIFFIIFAISQTTQNILTNPDYPDDTPEDINYEDEFEEDEPEEEPEKTEWTEDESLTIAIHYALDILNEHPGFETEEEYECVLSGGEATALRVPFGWQYDFDWTCTMASGGTISSNPIITVIAGVPSGL